MQFFVFHSNDIIEFTHCRLLGYLHVASGCPPMSPNIKPYLSLYKTLFVNAFIRETSTTIVRVDDSVCLLSNHSCSTVMSHSGRMKSIKPILGEG